MTKLVVVHDEKEYDNIVGYVCIALYRFTYLFFNLWKSLQVYVLNE